MTPYGQHQVQGKVYGGVIDHLTPECLAEVLIPDAPEAVQVSIDSKVLTALEYKDKANLVEDEAVRKLEDLLMG